jgi:hypothetical protein
MVDWVLVLAKIFSLVGIIVGGAVVVALRPESRDDRDERLESAEKYLQLADAELAEKTAALGAVRCELDQAIKDRDVWKAWYWNYGKWVSSAGVITRNLERERDTAREDLRASDAALTSARAAVVRQDAALGRMDSMLNAANRKVKELEVSLAAARSGDVPSDARPVFAPWSVRDGQPWSVDDLRVSAEDSPGLAAIEDRIRIAERESARDPIARAMLNGSAFGRITPTLPPEPPRE